VVAYPLNNMSYSYDSETDYSSDGSFEIRRYQSFNVTTDQQCQEGQEGQEGQVPLELEEEIEIIPKRRTIATKIPKPVPREPAIVDFFCEFVTLVEAGCKRVKEMINYQQSRVCKTDELPYPRRKVTPCTRLELESEMRYVSPKNHDEFRAKVMESRMRWLIRNHLQSNRSFSEANVTALMYEGYVGKYVCINEGRSISVWMFEDRWTEVSHAEIWQEMSTTFVEFVRSFSNHEDDEWEILCDDIVRYLSAVVSRERIQRDLIYRLTNNAFQSKLNSKTHLIGMENGVYDLKQEKLRDALPMDYVSMSTGINYLEEDDKKLRGKLEEILRTIFPNRQVYKFFIQSCASLLEGRNKEKYVYIWWGKGNNAKSMMERLLACALGDYSTVAATSLVTGKRGNADNASPQLSALEGKLAVFLQEPNPNETIKIGMIKELSGNDAITARALFKGNRTFIPKFKLIIVCNSAIEIPNIDVAFTNRLIVIPFESTFRTKEDYRQRKKRGTLTKYDHLMDSSVANKISKYAKVFFRMLVKEFEEMADEPIFVPKRVRKTTNEYIMANNFSVRYIKTQCTEDEDGEVNIKSLHSELKRWMNEHHGGKKVPNIDIFREEVTNCGYYVDIKGIVHGLVVDFD
jgi:P4 family phage/plasmid primase-like protien